MSSVERRTIRAYLELARPANVVTAWADVLAGLAVSGLWMNVGADVGPNVGPIHESALLSALSIAPSLLIATTGLYAGGVIFNDVFDAELDAEERPERPIPSRRVSKKGAAIFGGLMLAVGVLAALFHDPLSGALALFIAAAALVYDRYTKHHAFFGPLNMGLCRGANLLLGVSAVPTSVMSLWYLGFLPIVYIAAITYISRSEVHGGTRKQGNVAMFFLFLVVAALILMAFNVQTNLGYALIFISLFIWMVAPSFARAARQPEPANIKRAVKAGILGLIPMNAALAVVFASWPFGVIILLLLPISIGLARVFAVT